MRAKYAQKNSCKSKYQVQIELSIVVLNKTERNRKKGGDSRIRKMIYMVDTFLFHIFT